MAVPNFPSKPRSGFDSMSFPNDLKSGQRQFYTNITFMDYSFDTSSLMQGGAGGGAMVTLPMPRRLNDAENIIWEEWSGMDKMLGLAQTIAPPSALVSALTTGGEMASIGTGLALNPFMYMMFKRPQFKEHTLSWTLTPNSQQESDTLRRIINKCKKSALPSTTGSVFLMKYPQVAQVTLKASGSDRYLYKFKPCAIISVQVEYTAAGMPSFFKSGAPTTVNLTLQLKEIQLWKSDDIQDV
jgi:hypothetical protein